MEQVAQGADVFFVLVGAILVFAMHGGFAFLEVGTVQHKNQVNALVKILVDFAISTITYFFIGYWVARGVTFLVSADVITGSANALLPGTTTQAQEPFPTQGFELVKFFFFCTFAAAVPAIISGGIAERVKFSSQCIATALLVGLAYPLIEGVIWESNLGLQETYFESQFGHGFHDFAGSIVVHAFGGWAALGAVLWLGARNGRYTDDGRTIGIPPSSIPWLAMGSWMLCIGWFGFNVMSALGLKDVSGLVAMNSLMAMVGGIMAALFAGRGDPGFVHNGALAGLVAVCAGSDVMHPIGSLVTGAVAGVIFVMMFQIMANKWKIDDVLGVWPLHGLCGLWGGIACGIFGLTALGGMGGVSLTGQIIGSIIGSLYGLFAGAAVYGLIKMTYGIRLTAEEERIGADLSIHKISANPENDMKFGPT